LDYIRPKSALDVGCGTGAFLSIFREHGVTDILGVDGPWVSKDQRRIPANSFLERDLEHPLDLHRTFDLVISLEVAEHLPEAAAATFVRNLTRHGEVVLFSGAIPGQGGTHHLNEQWPSYWTQRFEEEGFVAVDCLRPLLWNKPEVSFWYAQNILFFIRNDALARFPELQDKWTRDEVLPLVHPKLFEAVSRRTIFERLADFVPFRLRRVLSKLIRPFL
jgi:SAM-dependent methyltransferase